MAKSKNVKVEGIIQWAKVFDANRDMEGYDGAFEDCDGAYTVNLQMDAANLQKLKDAGCPKEGKPVGDGLFDMKFVRKHADPRLAEWPELGGPPGVYDENGNEWDFDTDGVIPNGSYGTVLVSIYPARKTKGTRLLKIQVLEKAEMEDSDDFLQKPTKKGTPPKTVAKTKAKIEHATQDDGDDEIPF